MKKLKLNKKEIRYLISLIQKFDLDFEIDKDINRCEAGAESFKNKLVSFLILEKAKSNQKKI